MKRVVICCETFGKSLEDDWGRSGYGHVFEEETDLVEKSTVYTGRIIAGIMSESLKFCPWCGKPIEFEEIEK